MAEENKFALHAACREGKYTIVESLLNADPKAAARKDDDGRLPIHWAVSSNQLEVTNLLVAQKGFDAEVQDDSGWTPLMIAVSIKDGDKLVDLLLGKGADVNEKNNSGQTALHFAASKNNLDVARKLLDQTPPASARVRDRRGQYAIHRAAAVGSTPMVSLLLTTGKSPLDATDSAGQTALHHAVAEGHGKSWHPSLLLLLLLLLLHLRALSFVRGFTLAWLGCPLTTGIHFPLRPPPGLAGDTAVALLKAGASTDKKDVDGCLALDLAPDKAVQKYIEQVAEREGIEIGTSS
ncbi:hypothetical protein RB601_007256 [Gaeumannomyces tritici]